MKPFSKNKLSKHLFIYSQSYNSIYPKKEEN